MGCLHVSSIKNDRIFPRSMSLHQYGVLTKNESLSSDACYEFTTF
jgi:hypothetical protein